jgi:hypothetical protein
VGLALAVVKTAPLFLVFLRVAVLMLDLLPQLLLLAVLALVLALRCVAVVAAPQQLAAPVGVVLFWLNGNFVTVDETRTS